MLRNARLSAGSNCERERAFARMSGSSLFLFLFSFIALYFVIWNALKRRNSTISKSGGFVTQPQNYRRIPSVLKNHTSSLRQATSHRVYDRWFLKK